MFEYTNGDKYEGQIANDQKNGKGICCLGLIRENKLW